MKPVEHSIEKFLFSSRWFLAPFYIGLSAAILLLLWAFVLEFIHLVAGITTMTPSIAVLGVLSLIDLSLAGNLLLIVIFSGYENFVSKFSVEGHEDRPGWQGKVDFSALKLKLVASIVAISGIHLLKVFMNVADIPDREIQWMVAIHLVFVVSGVLLALMDKIASSSHKSK